MQKLNFLRICQWNGFISLTCPDKCPTHVDPVLCSSFPRKSGRKSGEHLLNQIPGRGTPIHYCSADWDNIRRRNRIHLLNQTFVVLSAGCHRFWKCPRETQQTSLLSSTTHISLKVIVKEWCQNRNMIIYKFGRIFIWSWPKLFKD